MSFGTGPMVGVTPMHLKKKITKKIEIKLRHPILAGFNIH
jgi:hypothetical protein